MKKILLVCNAGMSTSILAKRMCDAGQGEYEVNAYGETEYLSHLDGVDCILIGPQIRYLLDSINKSVNNEIPVASIDTRTYGKMDGAAALKLAKSLIGDID